MNVQSQNPNFNLRGQIGSPNPLASLKDKQQLLNVVSAIQDDVENLAGLQSIINLFNGEINLNPIITCEFVLAPLSHNFVVNDVVTDAAGNSWLILTTDGSTTMTLTNGTPVAPPIPATFTPSDSISGSISGATAIVTGFNWGDQIINLTNGNNFVEVDLILTGVAGVNALDLELWSGVGRTGTQYFSSNNGASDSLMSLVTLNDYINSSDFVVPTNPKISVQNILYATVGTTNGTSKIAQTIINGQPIN